jgi:type IV secretory pathway VirB2 component (pilin)
MTPPVNDVKPLAKQNTFVAQTLTGVSIAGAAASQYSAPIKSAADQLAAFTGAPVIEHISTILITVAGLCAMAGIVSAVLKHRAERQ